MKKLLFLLLICLGTVVSLCIKFQQIVNTPQKNNSEQILQINSGDSLLNVANSLYAQKLIKQKWQFILYMKINRLYPYVKAGEYLIDKDISIVELGNLITSGRSFLRKITFAEGLTSCEIMNILSNNNYLSQNFKPFNEGYVLPETYTFSRGDTRQKIVNKAHAELKKTLQEAWNERDADLPLKNKEEMLILASIVEKETGIASERPQVASVFINRLRKGMLLQTDPTVIYALTQGKTDLNRKLTHKDLETDNPYNTYKYAGLPPSPICNPGKEAIMAVAHPDKTPYLYFVASGNGGHNFARTLAEHNNNVRQWRKLNK